MIFRKVARLPSWLRPSPPVLRDITAHATNRSSTIGRFRILVMARIPRDEAKSMSRPRLLRRVRSNKRRTLTWMAAMLHTADSMVPENFKSIGYSAMRNAAQRAMALFLAVCEAIRNVSRTDKQGNRDGHPGARARA